MSVGVGGLPVHAVRKTRATSALTTACCTTGRIKDQLDARFPHGIATGKVRPPARCANEEPAPIAVAYGIGTTFIQA